MLFNRSRNAVERLSPEPSPGDICERLTDITDWRTSRAPGFSEQRSVTWASYPYRYLLHEYARAGKGGSRVAKRFELQRLSAARSDTGLHDYSRYYIFQGELQAVWHIQVRSPVDLTPANKAVYDADFEFVLQNGFYTPTSEDKLELDFALQQASMDGVNPYGQ